MFYFYFKWFINFVTQFENNTRRAGANVIRKHIPGDEPPIKIAKPNQAAALLAFIGVVGPLILIIISAGIAPAWLAWWLFGYAMLDYLTSLTVLVIMHLMYKTGKPDGS